MKYLEFISKFWEYNQEATLGTSATAIYMFLIHKWHNEQYKDFSLSDIEIGKELRLTTNTVKSGKEILYKKGLISYQTRNGLPCSYKIIEGKKKVVRKEINSQKKLNENISKNKSASVDDTIQKEVAEIQTSIKQDSQPNPDIPSLDEFLSFSKTIKNYTSDLDSKIEAKYASWLENGWKTESKRPITNWKQILKSNMPYIIDSQLNNDISLSTINRANLTGVKD